MALCKSPFEVWSVCCPDIIPAPPLSSPLSAKGVCRNVLFLKRPRRRSSLLGIPSVRQSLPCLVHIVQGKNRMHGRDREGGNGAPPTSLGRAYGSCLAQYGLGTGGTDGLTGSPRGYCGGAAVSRITHSYTRLWPGGGRGERRE